MNGFKQCSGSGLFGHLNPEVQKQTPVIRTWHFIILLKTFSAQLFFLSFILSVIKCLNGVKKCQNKILLNTKKAYQDRICGSGSGKN